MVSWDGKNNMSGSPGYHGFLKIILNINVEINIRSNRFRILLFFKKNLVIDKQRIPDEYAPGDTTRNFLILPVQR
jgi:hypothetical protein